MATETAQQRQDRENYESAQAWQRERNAYLLTLAPTVAQGEAIAQANAASAAAWQKERGAYLASQATPSPAAASAYTQTYIPGNYTPDLVDDNGNLRATKYGEPIYSIGTDRVPRTLIGRVGMAPVVTDSNRSGTPTFTFADDPAYQKSQQVLDFEKKIASGEVQSSGLYGPETDGGKGRKAFVERQSAYQSYDPATNMVRFYDPEGNITQEGPRASSVIGGALGGLLTGFNQTTANPDFQKAVMLAALAAAGYGALGGTGISLAGGESAQAAAAAAGTDAGFSSAQFGGGLLGGGGGGEAAGALVGGGGAAVTAGAPSILTAGSAPGALAATEAGYRALPSSEVLLGSGLFTGGATAAGGGFTNALTSALGSAAGSGLGGASSYVPALITGGLGAIGSSITAEKAREAAQTQSAAQIEAARIAADAAKFRPVGVTTRFGTSQFIKDASGNVIGAGYGASPEIQAYQNRLSALAARGLTGAEGAQVAYAPLTAGAQSLFNLGQGYLQQTPEQQAADYIAKQQALLAPGQEQQLAQLQNKLLAQGRGGLSIAQGGNMAATSPELAAYYNALAQSNLQLAAQGQQAGQQQATFGAGLLGAGSDLMGKYYGGQTAAYAPFATAMDTTSGLESLAQQPLTLGTQIGGQTTAAAAQAGQLLSQGIVNSAATQAPGNAFSYSGNILSQFGNNPQLTNALNKSFGVTDPRQDALIAALNRIYAT